MTPLLSVGVAEKNAPAQPSAASEPMEQFSIWPD